MCRSVRVAALSSRPCVNKILLFSFSAAAFQQGKIPPTPFPGAPPPGGSLLPHPNISESLYLKVYSAVVAF